MGWFKLFLSLHVAGSPPLSFYSRLYMVWKMLVEGFQDGCLVLGNLWYANGMIIAISEGHDVAGRFSIKFLLKRIYGLEKDAGWIIQIWLYSARLSLIWKWDDYSYSYFWGSCCRKVFHQVSAQDDIIMVWKKMLVEEFKDGCLVLGNLWYANEMIIAISEDHVAGRFSIKFLLKSIYGLEEDVGWRIQRWLFSAGQSLKCKWDDFSYFWAPCCRKPSTEFLLKRIYGFEDVGWRIPRWLFSARQFLICKWDDLSYFWVSMLPEVFDQVSA